MKCAVNVQGGCLRAGWTGGERRLGAECRNSGAAPRPGGGARHLSGELPTLTSSRRELIAAQAAASPHSPLVGWPIHGGAGDGAPVAGAAKWPENSRAEHCLPRAPRGARGRLCRSNLDHLAQASRNVWVRVGSPGLTPGLDAGPSPSQSSRRVSEGLLQGWRTWLGPAGS